MTEMANLAFSQAHAHHVEGELDRAIILYRSALQLDQPSPELLYFYGICLLQAGELDESIEMLQRGLEIAPNHYHTLINLGLAYYGRNDFYLAVEQFRKALDIGEHTPALYLQMGLALHGCGEYQSAAEHFKTANVFGSHEPLLYATWFAALQYQFRCLEAFDVAERWQGRHNNQTCEVRAQQLTALAKFRLQRAAQSLETSLNDYLVDHPIYSAFCAEHQNEIDLAIRLYKRHLENKPDDAKVHFNHAICLFQQRRYQEAWSEFEWRNREGGLVKAIKSDLPVWTGVEQGTVLVHSEQGAGDVLQFMRFFPLMQQRGAKVVFASYTDILELLRQGDDAISMDIDERELRFDYQIPLLSLGKIFCQDRIDVAADEPYVFPNSQKSAQWKERLGGFSGIKIGLVWAGNKKHVNDMNRSMSLAQWSFLARIPGVQYFSVQKGGPEREIATLPPWFHVHDLGPEIADFGDTAAILENLDLLISVDTSVAHLAGAMHRPVWMFVPAYSDWRWEKENELTPWYPSMRLFRQSADATWASTYEAMDKALRAELENRSAENQAICSCPAMVSDELAIADPVSRAVAAQQVAQYAGADALVSMPETLRHTLRINHSDLAAYVDARVNGINTDLFALLDGDQLQVRAASHALMDCDYPDLPEAGELLNRFVEGIPAGANKLLGLIANRCRDYARSISYLSAHLRDNPRDLGALLTAGMAATRDRQFELAVELLQRACAYYPDSKRAWHAVGWALFQSRSWATALVALERALELAGGENLDLLGLVCYTRLALRQFDRVAECIQRVQVVHPHAVASIWMRIRLAQVQGDAQQLKAALAEGRREFPNDLELEVAEAMANLASTGDRSAWLGYEARLRSPDADKLDRFSPGHGLPRWDGSDLAGRTLLVYAEQGLGDTLQFMRYYLPLREQVVWVCPDKLVNYMRRYFPQVVSKSAAHEHLPVADVYCESMSFPALTGLLEPDDELLVRLNTKSEREAISAIDEILAEAGNKPRIGLVWAGNPAHNHDHWRSCEVSEFAPLLARQDLAVFSLQKDDASNQVFSLPREIWPHNLAVCLEDLTDTTYALSKLDVLISVDTAVVHLAGSLGVPAILLQGAASDWRWGLAAKPHRVYSSVSVVFQKEPGNWSDAVADAIILLDRSIAVGGAE
ncbi:tetratricopeptide repeat protein [Jeongeupia wiesaeckerbachi]|uniref:tetratricopeptide repeat protein n=1 Tax=Jeongeupia wiesaeckerbachi TaxID=3051218 RepID=UPI003D801962